LKRWKDGVDDAIHALRVHEADHGPSTTANLRETAFDDIGGAQLLPQVSGEAEEGQLFRQIRFQLCDSGAAILTATAGVSHATGLNLSSGLQIGRNI
jgi:hypothetical protein